VNDMGRRSAVVSLIVAVPDGRANESPNCLSARDEGGGRTVWLTQRLRNCYKEKSTGSGSGRLQVLERR